MPHRVICPACGKSNRLPEGDAALAEGTTIVCLACGKLIPVNAEEVQQPAVEGDGGERPRDAVDLETAPQADPVEPAPDVAEAASFVPPARSAAARRPAARRTASKTSVAQTLVVATLCLALGAGAGVLVARLSGGRGGDVSAAEMRELLALKGEAESLATAGNLKEAHAKYQVLQQRLVGKRIEDPLNWDIMERAKVDQDRIFTLLLDRIEATNPPEQAMRAPGTGSANRADDAWVWPRVGTGGRAGPQDRGAASQPVVVERLQDVTQEVRRVASPATGEAPPEQSPAGQEGVADVGSAEAGAPAAAADDESPTTREDNTAATEVAATAPAGPVVQAKPRPVPPRWVSEKEVTDAEIGYAITRGADYLLAQVKDGQLAPLPGMTRTKHAGRNALVVYALLHAGRATNDPRLDPKGEFMGRLVDVMKSHDMSTDPIDPMQPVTYARSLRAAALAFNNRPQDREALKADAEWLIKAAVGGAYTYDDQFSNGAALREMGAADPEDLAPGEAEGADAGWDEPSPLVPEWADPRDLLCDGLHDPRTGREIRPPPRMRSPAPNRLQIRTPTPPPGPPPQRRTPMPTDPGGFDGPVGGGGARVFRRLPGQDRTAPPEGISFPWDNSNSQYGLLGVWAAAEVGVEVPNKYWEAVQRHWSTYQLKTGEWGYIAPDRDGYLPMTCGGIASLWVTYDWLVAPKTRGQVGRQTMSDNLMAGMKWLESADNAINTPVPGKTHYPGYDLFGLERVGLASGFKYFGAHDWYRVLAARSVGSQYPNGAWGWEQNGHPDGIIETAYHLLFLSHGRHPIFMNKLRFAQSRGETADGKPMPAYWANRPRDIANLTRFATRQFERPFNWQVVDLNREWHDWLDCPVLYIASHTAPLLTEADFAKLRQFTEAGGLLFTHADASSQGFTNWVREDLISKTFPGRRLETLPEDHPIYTLHYDIKKTRPKLDAISNGSRLLLVHSQNDLATAWQQRADRTQTPLFQLGAHMFLYAAGKMDFRNRIDSPYVPPAKGGTRGTVAVARVRHAGDWDPEPGAWRRFASLYQWENEVNVPVSTVDPTALDVKKTPVAHLTGTRAVEFTDEQAKAIRAYVESGGMLLVDACGGSSAFDVSVREGLLPKAFPGLGPRPVPKDHPLLAVAGDDGGQASLALRLRPYNTDKLKMTVPGLERIALGTGAVILSRVDITTGLLGTNTLTVVGYDPPYAQAIVWNLLDWTLAQRAVAGAGN